MLDDVVALLALHGRAAGLFKHVDDSRWKPLMVADQLWDDHWLLAYEGSIHGWLPSASGADYIGADPVRTELRAANVSFYAETARLREVSAAPPGFAMY